MIRDVQKIHAFVIDDRQRRDLDSRRKLYGYFCQMFARMVGDEELEIVLYGNVPMSPAIEEFAKVHGTLIRRPGNSQADIQPQAIEPGAVA